MCDKPWDIIILCRESWKEPPPPAKKGHCHTLERVGRTIIDCWLDCPLFRWFRRQVSSLFLLSFFRLFPKTCYTLLLVMEMDKFTSSGFFYFHFVMFLMIPRRQHVNSCRPLTICGFVFLKPLPFRLRIVKATKGQSGNRTRPKSVGHRGVRVTQTLIFPSSTLGGVEGVERPFGWMERNILKIEKPNNGKIGHRNWFASFPPAFFLGGISFNFLCDRHYFQHV